MRGKRRRWRALGSLFLIAAAVAPASGGLTACDDGPWYDTAPDPDLSYLPRGDRPVEARGLSWDLEGQAIAVDGYVPTQADKAPVVIMMPGFGIVKARYRWLGTTLASHGIATFVVQPDTSFASTKHILGTRAALAADQALAARLDLTRVVLAGHSAGCLAPVGLTDVSVCPQGVCSPGDTTPTWLRGLILFGYHNQNQLSDSTPMAAANIPWLLLTGSKDGVSTPEKAAATLKRLQDRPIYRIEVQGANHFQMTDYVDPQADLRLADDNTPSIANRTARLLWARSVVAFAKKTLLGDAAVPADLGTGGDDRLAVEIKQPRLARAPSAGLPRVMRERVPMTIDGVADAADVVAAADFQGDHYLLVRNHVVGAQIWRMTPDGALARVPLPGGAAGGFYDQPRLAGLLGAMIVYKDELYVGVTSGTQGAELGSTGAELWAFDGADWRAVISRRADADPALSPSGCTAAGTTAKLTVPGQTWTPGQLAGATLDDIGAVPSPDLQNPTIVLTVVGNDASSLTVQQNDLANDDSELTDCARLAGKTLYLRSGSDESGFGEPWNKGIAAMAVMSGKLYVGTALNYEDGAELWVSSDGHSFSRAIDNPYLGEKDGKPISTSISALGVSSVSGSERLYVGATGIMGYGARLLELDPAGARRWIIDDAADADDTGLDEAGSGHDNQQIASILEWKGRLWIATLNFGGFELLSTADGTHLDLAMGRDGPFGAGWGDPSQLAGRLFVVGDELWVAGVAFVQLAAELADKSAYAVRTADGVGWDLASAHGFGINAVTISQIFSLGGKTWAFTSGGALAQPQIFRPLGLYVLRYAEE
jgi:dienelactone hydrolase